MLRKISKFAPNKTNREILSWLGGIVVAICGLIAYFFPPGEKKSIAPPAPVITQQGTGIVSGRDTVINAPVSFGADDKQLGKQVAAAQKPLTDRLEALAAQVSREKGVDIASLRPILMKFGEEHVRDEDISARLSEKADDLLKLSSMSRFISEANAEVRAGNAEAAVRSAASAFSALPSLSSRSVFASTIYQLSPYLIKRVSIDGGGRAITWGDENTVVYAPAQANSSLISISVENGPSNANALGWLLPKIIRPQDDNIAAVSTFRVTSSGRLVAIFNEGSLGIAYADNSFSVPIKEIGSITLRADPTAASIGRQGKIIAAASIDGAVVLTECQHSPPQPFGCITRLLPNLAASVVAVSPDETKIAVGDLNGAVSIFDIAGQRVGQSFIFGEAITSLDWAQATENALLAVGSSEVNNGVPVATITVIDMAASPARLMPKLRLESTRVSAMAWNPQKLELAYSCRGYSLCISDVEKGTLSSPQEIGNHKGAITRIAWSQNGSRLASLSADATLALWNRTQSTDAVYTFDTDSQSELSAVSQSRNRRWVATGAKDGTVRIWSSETRDLHRTYEPPARSRVQSLSWNKAGLLAASHEDGSISLVPADRNQAALSIRIDDDRNTSITFTDDETIATPQRSGKRIILIPIGYRTPKDLRYIDGVADEPWGIAADEQGKRLFASYSNGQVIVWDLTTKTHKKLTDEFFERQEKSGGESVSISFDNRWLATSGGDRYVRTYDIAQGKSHIALQMPNDEPISVAFSPDSLKLAALSVRGLIHVWSIGDKSVDPVLSFEASQIWKKPLRSESSQDGLGSLSWVGDDSIAVARAGSSLSIFSLKEAKWASRASGVTEGGLVGATKH